MFDNPFTVAGRALACLPPETAHRATIRLLAAYGGAPRLAELPATPDLAIDVAGVAFPNPLGLAAGFDKNGEAVDAMLRFGFGFVEIGAATPRPQPGNDRPRVFRLREDEAVINRYGFNNDGHALIARRLKRRRRPGIVGVNLGANKYSEDRTEDYVKGIAAFEGLVDFYTVNVSSPNTPGLRALQDRDALADLLVRVVAARAALRQTAPIFLKIAPDLTDADKTDLVDVALSSEIDGLIISNTTIARPASLRSAAREEAGGLSGAPLFTLSTELLRDFSRALDGRLPLIGVGGVRGARDAYEKILAGASLVQLYTALVYQGPTIVRRILGELPTLMAADGFRTIGEAVGRDA